MSESSSSKNIAVELFSYVKLRSTIADQGGQIYAFKGDLDKSSKNIRSYAPIEVFEQHTDQLLYFYVLGIIHALTIKKISKYCTSSVH